MFFLLQKNIPILFKRCYLKHSSKNKLKQEGGRKENWLNLGSNNQRVTKLFFLRSTVSFTLLISYVIRLLKKAVFESFMNFLKQSTNFTFCIQKSMCCEYLCSFIIFFIMIIFLLLKHFFAVLTFFWFIDIEITITTVLFTTE